MFGLSIGELPARWSCLRRNLRVDFATIKQITVVGGECTVGAEHAGHYTHPRTGEYGPLQVAIDLRLLHPSFWLDSFHRLLHRHIHLAWRTPI
jgi:hypothetical protein